MRYRLWSKMGRQRNENWPPGNGPVVSSSISRLGDVVVEVAEVTVAAIFLVRRIRSLVRPPRRELTDGKDLAPAFQGGGEKHA